ncbi:phenylacetic acid degradation protein [Laceyella tengchongensis]
MTEKMEYGVFEVFVQRTHLDHHVHVGNLLAPSADVAAQMARENFLRREKVVSLWVVPRDQITAVSEHGEWLGRELDRSYREVSGYTENGRLWRMFKEKALTLEEIVAYVERRSEGGRRNGHQRRPSGL